MQRRAMILLAAACLVGACKEERKPDASWVRPVRTQTVERMATRGVRTAVGDIQPQRDIDLSFRISGKLVQRLVDVGDKVRAGQPVARIDPEDYVQKRNSAEGDLAAARAVLVEAQAQEASASKLFRDGFATKREFDTAQKNLHSAKAKLDSAEASLKLAEAQLAYTELRAEVDGVVTATGAEEGQVVSTGQLILRMVEPRFRDAVFDVSDAAFFDAEGATGPDGSAPLVRVALLGHPEISATGRIREISPVADDVTRTYQVRVALVDAPAEMRFGASVNGTLDLAVPKVVMLPASALFDRAGSPAVWVVDPAEQVVSLKPVEVARYEAEGFVVKSGLHDGEIVVTAGVHQLRENQKVALEAGVAK